MDTNPIERDKSPEHNHIPEYDHNSGNQQTQTTFRTMVLGIEQVQPLINQLVLT